MDEENKVTEENNVDELKKDVQDVMEKIRTQSMLLGGRSMALVIARMIDSELNKPGKRTMNDMKRIVNGVRKFCQVAIDHPVETPKFGEDVENGEEA